MRKSPMRSLKCLPDPLGQLVMISASGGICDSAEKLITNPVFIIEIGKEERYYFKMFDRKMNLLVATRTDYAWYLTETCILNPSPDYISKLLRRGGRVISFL